MKSFLLNFNLRTSMVYRMHTVDLQRPKKLKILKTFPNLINLFLPPHNGIS